MAIVLDAETRRAAPAGSVGLEAVAEDRVRQRLPFIGADVGGRAGHAHVAAAALVGRECGDVVAGVDRRTCVVEAARDRQVRSQRFVW